ncbi:cytochrome P450 [Favolaschia claudopus]|uniref:Cytochrome P450 n=1 Tax=Favolaschia claudopus TaxID=2862362 RepID=A0AAW0DYY4_9AGAR
MILKSIASILGAATAYGLYLVLKTLYRELTSPLRYIRGPRSTHWFYGNLKGFINDEAGFEENLVKEYGRTWKFHRFFGQSALYSTDPKALHHFLSNTHVYQKSEASRFSLGQVVGPGILVVEGEQHKQQNPAFGIPQVRELTEIFVDKSIQLRDIWTTQASKSDGIARVEALSWLSKATLDIIGLAGFNYKIDALAADDDAPPNELAEAFEASFASDTGFSFIRFLQMRYPLLRRIPLKRDKTAITAQQTMKRIGRELLASSKREVSENGTFETGSGRARDLLTLLVRANTSKDVPAHQRLSDEDVIAQVPTFLVAGHANSTAVTWTLFALTQNPAAQTRLREELLSFPTDRPTLDELNSLRYLDCVVRETLRVHAPVTMTGRMAMQDDVVPLSTPVTDSRGEVHESIRVRKGDQILIPILSLNHDTDIWGTDAMEFRPERWENDIPEASAIPGVWGHMMTFIGGPRSCIGFRFSLAEMKALIFTLVRAFEFELAVPREEMGATGNSIVLRPAVITDLAAGNQLPLVVKTVVR